jgi:hypothetical protein
MVIYFAQIAKLLGQGGGVWDHIADLINHETPDIDVSVYTGR